MFNNRIYGLTKGQSSPTSRVRQDDQVEPAGHRSITRSARCPWPWRPRPPSSPAPSTPTPSISRTRSSGRPPQGLGLRRGPPELQHLQRRCVSRLHRPRGPRGPDARPRARQADDLRQGPRQGHPPQRPPARGRDAGRGRRSPRRTCSSTTRAETRSSRSCCSRIYWPDFPVPVGVILDVKRADPRRAATAQRRGRDRRDRGKVRPPRAPRRRGRRWVVPA